MPLRILGLALAILSNLPPQAWHLRYVDLSITIDPALHQINGVSRLTIAAGESAATTLDLDLGDSMTVDSAWLTSRSDRTRRQPGVRQPGHVQFALAKPATRNEEYFVTTWYHGQPIRRAVGFADHAGTPRPASFGLPLSAREWWPTIDDPTQKADSADIRIVAPSTLIAASNGRMVGRSTSPDGKTATSHWKVRHPIYPDVISFALADYKVLQSTVKLAGGRSLPVQLYVFPEDSGKATTDFASIPKIMEFYESRLGPYPFADEKYGFAEFARPSFREGQTITNIGSNFLTGKHESDQVIAHEMAHQWFGNSLTVGSWADIWLNESLSEFMSWQWIRESQGDSAYKDLFDQARKSNLAVKIAPASATDFNTLFGLGTFVKGPIVISMLRDMMGARVFDDMLRSYVSAHRYGIVETADFQKAAERAYGKPLDDFFQKWVYGDAAP